MKSLEQRLLDNSTLDPNTNCRLWTRWCDRDGYGLITYQGSTRRAHRLSYQVFVGPIPEGAHVLHSCHTPSCINSEHLYVGTHGDNMADMVRVGRSATGESHGGAKLNKKAVVRIRTLYADGAKQKDLACMFGVHQTLISYVVTGKIWKHV